MSFHVYIANEGGKDNPISFNEWMSAVSKCKDLTVRSIRKRNGAEVLEVFLPGKRKQYLWLMHSGVVHAQAPSEQLIHIMFFLANELNASVWNENFKKFTSFEDWERKTRHYRKLALEATEKQRKEKFKKLLLWVFLIFTSFLVGWSLSAFKII